GDHEPGDRVDETERIDRSGSRRKEAASGDDRQNRARGAEQQGTVEPRLRIASHDERPGSNREPAREPRRRHEHRREVDARHTASLLESPDRGRPAEGRDRRPMIVGEAGWLRGSALVAVIGVAVAGWLILGLGWNPVAGGSG